MSAADNTDGKGGDPAAVEMLAQDGDANQDEEAQVRGGSNNMDRVKLGGIVLAGILVFVGLLVGILYGSGALGGDPALDCAGDGFKGLTYVGADGGEVYLKYLFKLKSEDEAYTRVGALDACEDLGAKLWEVTGGAPEWNAVIADAGEVRNVKFWISAERDEPCPGQGGDAATCREVEAREGRGLRIRWPEVNQESTYSRFAGGPAGGCVYADAGDDRLWRAIGCDDEYHAACVKRNCKKPEPGA